MKVSGSGSPDPVPPPPAAAAAPADRLSAFVSAGGARDEVSRWAVSSWGSSCAGAAGLLLGVLSSQRCGLNSAASGPKVCFARASGSAHIITTVPCKHTASGYDNPMSHAGS